MINEKSKITIDVDLTNFDPEDETGIPVAEIFKMITRAAPEYGIRLSDIKEQSYSFKASGIANNLFLWWKNWFKICESKPKEDLTDFSQFKEFFFLDEDEDLEAAIKPSDMNSFIK